MTLKKKPLEPGRPVGLDEQRKILKDLEKPRQNEREFKTIRARRCGKLSSRGESHRRSSMKKVDRRIRQEKQQLGTAFKAALQLIDSGVARRGWKS